LRIKALCSIVQGSAQAISAAEGTSRRLTPDPKWTSISVSPLGREEQQQFSRLTFQWQMSDTMPWFTYR